MMHRGRRAGRARARPARSATSTRRRRSASEIGYPVVLKAAAGGGGKGMRVVARAEELAERAAHRRRARRRPRSATGRSTSRSSIDRPRHVEIQVLADPHGNVVHLGERECSIQRRHQKLVEESPSPAVDAGAARPAWARPRSRPPRRSATQNAGTVEFLLDRGRQLLLPRGEHPPPGRAPGHRAGDRRRPRASSRSGSPPASRCATGRTTLTLHGWAIECRIYAEDPDNGFLPSTGKIATLQRADRPGRARRQRRLRGLRGRALLRSDAGQADRLGRDARPGDPAHAARARASTSCSASARRSRSTCG